ncbi:MAG: acyl carrier protein [Prevotella sp.]|nr:acyl carrier protein [Prevotella sp.]
MTREEIIEKVNSLLAEEFEVEESEFAPDANLKETLSLDSINLVDLIALVQFNYKITIPVEDLKKIQTFADLYDYIEQHQTA